MAVQMPFAIASQFSGVLVCQCRVVSATVLSAVHAAALAPEFDNALCTIVIFAAT